MSKNKKVLIVIGAAVFADLVRDHKKAREGKAGRADDGALRG